MYYGRTFQEKEINIFRCCLILRLPLLQFLLKSVIMGPGSPFLSRDQYLYDSQRKKENCSKMRKKPSQVTDPFQYKLLVMWNFRLHKLFSSWVSFSFGFTCTKLEIPVKMILCWFCHFCPCSQLHFIYKQQWSFSSIGCIHFMTHWRSSLGHTQIIL